MAASTPSRRLNRIHQLNGFRWGRYKRIRYACAELGHKAHAYEREDLVQEVEHLETELRKELTDWYWKEREKLDDEYK